MRKLYTLVLFVSLFISSALAQSGVVIYEDHGFSGISRAIPNTWEATGVWSYFDEKISSIKVPEGTLVILYEDEGFKGAHKIIYSDWEATGKDEGWNDEISSIRMVTALEHYTLVYQCYVDRNGQWERSDDFSKALVEFIKSQSGLPVPAADKVSP